MRLVESFLNLLITFSPRFEGLLCCVDFLSLSQSPSMQTVVKVYEALDGPLFWVLTGVPQFSLVSFVFQFAIAFLYDLQNPAICVIVMMPKFDKPATQN